MGENQNGLGPYTDGSATMKVTGNDYVNDFAPSQPAIEWFNPPGGSTGGASISSGSPDEGEIGTSVTISGSRLANASSVSFNGVGAAISGDSATTITTSVPSGAMSGNISVTTPSGTATIPFTVLALPDSSPDSVIDQSSGLTSVLVQGPNNSLDDISSPRDSRGVRPWS